MHSRSSNVVWTPHFRHLLAANGRSRQPHLKLITPAIIRQLNAVCGILHHSHIYADLWHLFANAWLPIPSPHFRHLLAANGKSREPLPLP